MSTARKKTDAPPGRAEDLARAGEELKMAIWFVTRVGDADRAADLVRLAADAMGRAAGGRLRVHNA